MPKVKVKAGLSPKSNQVTAKLPPSAINGQIAMPSRYTVELDTGLEIKAPSGYCLCFSVVPELANRGLVATNAPGRLTEGKLMINVLNAGREIVVVGEGAVLADVWLEKIVKIEWEE